MQIKYVTLTGADDNTSVEDIVDLSSRYPFLEWGILFSQSNSGVKPRYPGWDWVCDLSGSQANYSAHLCGKWVDDALEGEITFLRDPFANKIFGRIQLNMAKGRLRQLANASSDIWSAIAKVEKPVLFGGPYQEHSLIIDHEKFKSHGAFPLFDASGGRGILTKKWPKPVEGVMCGYAGGLGPKNLEDELRRIEDVVGDATIWIDMESKLRNKENRFDINLCEEVCEIAGNYV